MRVLNTFLVPCASLYFWFVIALALLCDDCCMCSSKVLCIDKERVALLQFKHGLTDPANQLSSWGSSEDDDDCCKWDGIVCDNVTGQVHEIHLHGPGCPPYPASERYRNFGADYEYIQFGKERKRGLGGKINPSLLNLEQLEYLDLSCNGFDGIRIPSFIGSLENLRYLNLSSSQFSGDIPYQFGNLSNLHVLSLTSSLSPGRLSATNLQWLSGLSMLQHLDMSNVDLSKAFDWLQVINSVASLVELHLSFCDLTHIPFHLPIVNLTSLSVLDLHSNDFDNSLFPEWILSLPNLQSLDLVGCDLRGPVASSIVNGFHNMTSLRILRVSGNKFLNSSESMKGLSSLGGTLVSLEMNGCRLTSPILHNLRNMTSLISLQMSGNELNGTIPQTLGNLCSLKQIELSYNDFNEISLSEVFKSFFGCKSPKLESLIISASGVTGHLPIQLEQLNKLINIQLDENSISGQIPNFVGSLSFLQYLDLSSNSFSGSIPESLGGLSSLKQLYLSNNQLNGSLPESIGQLFNLEYLGIEYNLLKGVVNENHFIELRRLKQFSANSNALTLNPHLANWLPPFQLLILQLSSWNVGPQFPSWLQFQIELVELDISNTRISESMPQWLWSLCSGLDSLNLSHNQIHGTFFSSIPPSLEMLDVNSNSFSGLLPKLSNDSEIIFLDLSNNSFSGSLKQLLCLGSPVALRLFWILNLGQNNLSGLIPHCWKPSQSLRILNLEDNNLSGGIPKSMGDLSHLKLLNLRNNKLSGKLPGSQMNLISLEILELGRNKFTGYIPTWLSKGPKGLQVLSLRSNKFVGEIPHELCSLSFIQILDLADNSLSGNVPDCFSNFSVMSGKVYPQDYAIFSESINTIEFQGSASLVMKGREDIYSNILGIVILLDLSSNNFSGQITNGLMSLVASKSLNLSRNHFKGRIPEKIGDMKSLESLDLSLNQLDGEIPLSLSKLTSLSRLNLSYNNLTGRIPTGPQLQTLDKSGFIGNKLWGPPLTADHVAVPDGDGGAEAVEKGGDGSNRTDWGLIISILVGFVVGFWFVVGPLAISRWWRIAYFRILDNMRYGIYDAVVKCIPKIFCK